MGARSAYGPGTFCWVTLSTTGPDTAKRFYAALFGWEYDRAGADGGFSMARRYGANVAAIYQQKGNERARGLPPHWNNRIGTTTSM